MTVQTVFRSRLRSGVQAAYAEVASAMVALATAMPGFVRQSFFSAPDGERVTIVEFADAASHEAWAKHPDHRAAQQRGIEEFYESYDITVAQVTYHHHFESPATGPTPLQ